MKTLAHGGGSYGFSLGLVDRRLVVVDVPVVVLINKKSSSLYASAGLWLVRLVVVIAIQLV